MSSKCGREGCITWTTHGVEGTNKREFCGRHAGHSMVDLRSKAEVEMFSVWGRGGGRASVMTREAYACMYAGHATEGTVRSGGNNEGPQKKSAQEESAPRGRSKDSTHPAASATLKPLYLYLGRHGEREMDAGTLVAQPGRRMESWGARRENSVPSMLRRAW